MKEKRKVKLTISLGHLYPWEVETIECLESSIEENLHIYLEIRRKEEYFSNRVKKRARELIMPYYHIEYLD